ALTSEHWLLAYESAGQGWLNTAASAISADPFFSVLDQAGIRFYNPNPAPPPFSGPAAPLPGGQLPTASVSFCSVRNLQPLLPGSIWTDGTFRLFISHTSVHKANVGFLATMLELQGVHGFVAHEDIEPSREWQESIEYALATCDALAAYLTTDFVSSKWCDQ